MNRNLEQLLKRVRSEVRRAGIPMKNSDMNAIASGEKKVEDLGDRAKREIKLGPLVRAYVARRFGIDLPAVISLLDLIKLIQGYQEGDKPEKPTQPNPPAENDSKPDAPPAGNWPPAPFALFDGPHYFFGVYFSQNPDQLKPWLQAVKDSGLDGIGVEANGPEPVYEYNGDKGRKVDVDAEYDRELTVLVRAAEICDELGIGMEIKILNTNQSYAKTRSADWWYQIGKRFGLEFKGHNVLLMPHNENDARTSAAIKKAIIKGVIDSGFPTSRMVGSGTKPKGWGYVEHHPQKSDGSDFKKGGADVINCSDSGPAISDLYGKDWRSGMTEIREDRIIAFMQRDGKKTSRVAYSFRRVPDLAGLKIAGRAWRG